MQCPHVNKEVTPRGDTQRILQLQNSVTSEISDTFNLHSVIHKHDKFNWADWAM